MMERILRHRPSPAMIVACVALLVALGGTSYAAVQLPRNSVGTKQLRKGAVATAKIRRSAVTTSKIKDGQVKGADVDVASFPPVPRALAANSADLATRSIDSAALGGSPAADHPTILWAHVG